MSSCRAQQKVQNFIRNSLWYVPSKEQIVHTFKVDQLKSYYTVYITKTIYYKTRFYQSGLIGVMKKEEFSPELKETVENDASQFYEETEDGDISIYKTKYITEKTSWSQPDINNPHTILEMLE